MNQAKMDQTEYQKRSHQKHASEAVVLNYDLFKCRFAIAELSTTIAAYAISDQFNEEYEIALCDHFELRDIAVDEEEAAEDYFRDEDEFSRFMSWFCTYCSCSKTGKTFPTHYLMHKGKELTSVEQDILRSYEASYLGLYEVQETKPGEGLTLKDVFSNATYFVHDEYFSRMLCKWDLVYGGLLCVRDIYFFSGFDPIIVPPIVKCDIEEAIDQAYQREGAGVAALEDFFKRHSAAVFALVERAVHNFEKRAHLKNTDGDILFFSTLYFRIRDKEMFLKIIDSSPFFIPDIIDPCLGIKKADYIWIKNERSDKRIPENIVQGVLVVDDDILKAKCNSRERIEKLRDFILATFEDSLELKIAIFEKPEEQLFVTDCLTSPSPDAQDKNPSEEAALKEILMHHYKGWVDEKISALGNITPREAVASPQTRENLINLLKELENQNERAIRKGLKTTDVLGFPADMIRKELGL